MNTLRICERCHAPLLVDAPQGVCPSCLLSLGLDGPSDMPTLQSSRIEPAANITPGAAPPPRPGEDFGPYHILRVLGRGGMGEVFEAEHAPSGRRVALKVMNHALASEADRKRFLREGRLAASVSHPNAVYIYGSEEIQGTPVISMELVAGGTLKDRIKRGGPLPITEAVESALHIIDGLEAAHAAGVLHRDVKPANCFVTADGAVKVGDFGLSISTLARGESLLTASGSVLGTPAYASPEQLRGEDLDVASDIYSVGATLYHLLTGRPPHETTDFVKLITEVLDKTPLPPDKLRPEIPAGLAKVVLRSLAKSRSARFQGYAALRHALLPFSSTAPAPAMLGLRFVAGVVDELIGWLPSLVWLVVTGTDAFDSVISDRTAKAVFIAGGFYAFALLYYAIPEGLWGASLGKALCGLRVVGPNRSAPGIPRAVCRVLVSSAPAVLGVLGALLIHSPADFAARQESSGLTAYLPVWLLSTIALWMTIRRRNGFAGLHDLVTRTRVIARHAAHQRPRLAPAGAKPDAPPAAVEQLGPYEIVRSAGSMQDGELLLARDPALRRSVWIHRLPAGAPAVPARRRDLNRPGRLRWLNGHRDDAIAWDAYEKPDGMPFPALLVQPQAWSALRFWLHDLAEEIAAGSRTETAAPELAPDRIWITGAGRAVLLDFPFPPLGAPASCQREPSRQDAGAPSKPPLPIPLLHPMEERVPEGRERRRSGAVQGPDAPVHDFPGAQRFLHALSIDALRGTSSTFASAALPLHARPFLRSLAEARFETAEILLGNLRSLLGKQPVVGRQRRAAALVFGPAFALLVSVVVGGILHFAQTRSTREWPEVQFPGSAELRSELRILDWIFEDHDTRRAFRTHIAAHHRDLVLDASFWNHPKVKDSLNAENRAFAEKAVRDYPDVSRERVIEAERLIAVSNRSMAQSERLVGYYAGFSLFWILLALVAVVDIGCCLFLGHDLFLHLLGIAAVRRDGAAAGRLLLLWRNALAWGFCFIAVPAAFSWWMLLAAVTPSTVVTVTVGFLLPALVLTATACAVWQPARGLQDRLAGTVLVPR